MKKKKIAVIWLSLLMLFGFIVIVVEMPQSVKAGMIWVDDDYAIEDPTHKKTIQAAVDNATSGDTVYVYNGTYNENVVVNKTINLPGENRDTTIIQGGLGDVVRITADWVNITGFTFRSGGWNIGDAGIELDNVQNCRVFNNNAIYNGGYGIYLFNSSGNNISANNASSNDSNGIYIFYSNGNSLSFNFASNNYAGIALYYSNWNNITGKNSLLNNGHGILLRYSNGNNITSNNASSNNGGGILLLSSSNGNNITDNIALNNGNGISLSASDRNNIINNTASLNGEDGIELFYSNRNNITSNTVSSNNFGIYLTESIQNSITDNYVSLHPYYYGILLYSSIGINLTGNTMFKNGIAIHGDLIEHWNTHNINTSNIINGKPVYYWKNQTSGTIPIGAGQVILANCTNVSVENQDFTHGSIGIEIGYSSNINITGNNVSNNWGGIFLYKSDRNNIIENNASNERYGISLYYSNRNNITGNNFSSNRWDGINLYESSYNNITGNNVSTNSNTGIILSSSSYNNITENKVLNNNRGIGIGESDMNNIIGNNASSNEYDGIHLSNSDSNTIAGNNASSNKGYGIDIFSSDGNNLIGNTFSSNKNGIRLRSSFDNYVYYNNFINNTNQASDGTDNGNQWDNSYPSGGNYWSDYTGIDLNSTPNQNVPPPDGIGDTPYVLDADSQDNFPLMEPYTSKTFDNYTILKQGWNLISLPLIQTNQNLTKVLEMIDGYYDAVQWYDITDTSNPWKHNKVGKPYGNDLFKINETMGLWVHITQPGDTIFIYNGVQPSVNQSITLYQGWNLVGYPSLTIYNRTDGLNNIDFDNDVDAIWTHNATTQTWKEITASDNFEMGRGYWMHSKVTKTWIVPL